MNNENYSIAEKYHAIGICLDRYEDILRKSGNIDYETLNSVVKNRFDRFIDLDVSGVDVFALSTADDATLVHDVSGIFVNLERDSDDPRNSRLVLFSPRVGMLKKKAA